MIGTLRETTSRAPQGPVSKKTRAEVALLSAILLIAGCSSGPAEMTPTDVAVRLFVDSNANGAWDENDIPLPDVVVLLDEDVSAITDAGGRATFEGVSGRQHTVTLDEECVEDLATHSLICGSPSQTVDLDEGTAVLFCFSAKGFMEVDVSEETEEE
jgi:predicted component of type VI protein secretion system